MDKKRREQIERAFYGYQENKDKLKSLLRSSEIESKLLPATNYEKVLVQTTPKNTTEEIVVKMIDETEHLSRWVQVVDYTLIKYTGEYKDKLIKALYFDRMSINRAATKLHIDRRTVFRWKDEIFLSAETYAISLRILR